MEKEKIKKERQIYDAELKDELVRLLQNGKSAKELSKTFGIRENVLYRWKMKATASTKKNKEESQNDFTLRLIAENKALLKENERLSTEREILKKALGLFSTSS